MRRSRTTPRYLLPCVPVLLAAACGSGTPTTSAPVPTAAPSTTGGAVGTAAPSTAAETSVATGEPAESAPASAPAIVPHGRRDLGAGVTVDFRDDGTVLVKGKDRWGGKLNVTYESADFLKKAAATLTRSLADEPAAALTKLADELP